MQTLRTFLAVEVPWPVRSLAARLVNHLSSTSANVRWVDEQAMHFTLKFLGEVDTNDTPSICQAMQQAVGELSAFEIRVQGAGAFPVSQRPRTVWIGVDPASEEPFVDLHDRIEAELAELGHREEHRRYRPHMTLGRVRRSPEGIEELAALIRQYQDFDAGAMVVDEVTLFSSELTRNGPVYDVIGRVQLGE